jgi:hypothetical protein
MKISLILLSLMLFLPAEIGRAQEKKDSLETYKEPKTGLTFPAKLGSFSNRKAELYDHGRGTTVTYFRPDSTASIYLYLLRGSDRKKATDELTVKSEIEDAKTAISYAKSRGMYSSVKHISDTQIEIGQRKHKFTKSTFELTTDEGRLVSFILVSCYKEHILKIRLTCSTDTATAEKNIEEVCRDLAKVLDTADGN